MSTSRTLLKDPNGGLTAAGRAYFKKKDGSNLKPGVKGPADTPEKMKRKGSFLRRHFASANIGPLKDKSGKPTRRALSAQAWGEPIPENADDVHKLAAKGKILLKQYHQAKEGAGESAHAKKTAAKKTADNRPAAPRKTKSSKAAPAEEVEGDQSSTEMETSDQQKRPQKRTTQAGQKKSGSAKQAKKPTAKQVKKEEAKVKQEPKETPTRKAAVKKAASKQKSDTYTDPELRQKILEKIKAGDKGGRPGQWSARKAQLVAHEYKAAGGGYLKPYRTQAQRNLCSWTDEKWQTATGAKAIHGLTTSRYLPKKAWESLSQEERADTEKLKLEASAKGQQYVSNSPAAKEARRKASLRSKTSCDED